MCHRALLDATTSCLTSTGPTWCETVDRHAVKRWPSLREIRTGSAAFIPYQDDCASDIAYSHLVWPNYDTWSIELLPRSWRLMVRSFIGGLLSICQTFAASPAEPGGLPG
jgi:hypothetical protein